MKKAIKLIIFSLILIPVFSLPLLAQEPTQESANQEKSIEEEVEEKVLQASHKPKAYIGTVTDKTEDSMQLENDKKEIKLISIKVDEVGFARSNGSSQEIKYEDVGIGDFVIAMGYIDDNNVLSAKRIVLSSPSDEMHNETFLGHITQIEDDVLTVEKKPENTNFQVSLLRSTDITLTQESVIEEIQFSDLNTGDKIIVIGKRLNDSFEAERIHVVEQSPETEN